MPVNRSSGAGITGNRSEIALQMRIQAAWASLIYRYDSLGKGMTKRPGFTTTTIGTSTQAWEFISRVTRLASMAASTHTPTLARVH